MAVPYSSSKVVPNVKDHVIDLRSDVLSNQSEEMKAFMLAAEVGDDVFQEDPTTKALEEKAAKLLGKEAAMFVMTGTMGNLLCVMVHCEKRSSEVLLGNLSYIHIHEQGNISQIGGVHSHILKNLPDGTFDLDELKDAVRVDDIHLTTTQLVCIENTHNQLGGKVLPLQWLEKLGECCRNLGIPIHVDAARLLNAAVALDVSPARVARDCDTLCLCLSKGLGAPVGSVIVGTKEFIGRARRLRKAIGGGMEQPSYMAAAGIYALDHSPKLLKNDHSHAKAIAQAVADLKSSLIMVNPEDVHTNLIFLECDMRIVFPSSLCSRLAMVTKEEEAVLSRRVIVRGISMSKTSLRFALYYNITPDDVQLIIEKLRYVIKEYEKQQERNIA